MSKPAKFKTRSDRLSDKGSDPPLSEALQTPEWPYDQDPLDVLMGLLAIPGVREAAAGSPFGSIVYAADALLKQRDELAATIRTRVAASPQPAKDEDDLARMDKRDYPVSSSPPQPPNGDK